MASLLHVGLGNAAAATALALAAALACRALRGRRPAAAHALWLLVLLKLLTPPLWTVRVPVPVAGPAPVTSHAVAPPPFDPEPLAATREPEAAAELTSSFAAVPDHLVDAGPSGAVVSPPATPPNFDGPAARLREWGLTAAALTWVGGSVACLALVLARCRRFARLLRHARPAPPPQARRVAELSSRLGIAHTPEAWVVPGAVCPMLWAPFSRPRLLLPAGLWGELDESQRDTLIAHELAHLRRRDHWVRLVEVAATVLYWWHPAVWWARRELREAEEQCCDAWVVWSIPRCARQYMNAILKAVDFVSDAAPAPGPASAWRRCAVPPVACGMASGEFRHLERRLSMIRQNEIPGRARAARSLGRVGLFAVCAGAVGLLPLAPSLAQQDPQPRAVTVVEAPVADTEPVGLTEVEVRPVPESAFVEVYAPTRTHVVQVTPTRSYPVAGEVPVAVNTTTATAPSLESDKGAYDVDLARAQVERLAMELEAAKARLATAEAVAGRSRKPGAKFAPKTSPNALNSYAKRDYRVAPKEAKSQDSQRRLDELERKLDRLLDEVQELKDGRSGRGAPNTPPVSLRPM